jgi:hypothetical protein
VTAFSILSTTSHAVSGVAYTFDPDSGVADINPENPQKQWLIRVWSNTGIHLRSDGQDATTSDFPIAAGLHGEVVALPPGGSISVVKQSGQADGMCWFAHCKRG